MLMQVLCDRIFIFHSFRSWKVLILLKTKWTVSEIQVKIFLILHKFKRLLHLTQPQTFIAFHLFCQWLLQRTGEYWNQRGTMIGSGLNNPVSRPSITRTLWLIFFFKATCNAHLKNVMKANVRNFLWDKGKKKLDVHIDFWEPGNKHPLKFSRTPRYHSSIKRALFWMVNFEWNQKHCRNRTIFPEFSN